MWLAFLLSMYLCILCIYLFMHLFDIFFIENIVRNVSFREGKAWTVFETMLSATADASASDARREREIKRDRTRRAGPSRGLGIRANR